MRDAGLHGDLEALRVRVDHDEPRACGTQIPRDLLPDPAEPTDEVVVGVGVDHTLPPVRPQQAGDVAGDEELRHRHQPVEERTHAEDDQEDLDHLTAGRLGWRHGPDGRDRVHRPHEPEPRRDVLGQDEPDRATDDEEDDQEPELRQPAQEDHEVPVCPGLPGTGREPEWPLCHRRHANAAASRSRRAGPTARRPAPGPSRREERDRVTPSGFAPRRR